MINRMLKSIPGLILAFALVTTASANVTQLGMPYSNVNIFASASSVNGYYDNFDWRNDIEASTTVSGSVDTFDSFPEDARKSVPGRSSVSQQRRQRREGGPFLARQAAPRAGSALAPNPRRRADPRHRQAGASQTDHCPRRSPHDRG